MGGLMLHRRGMETVHHRGHTEIVEVERTTLQCDRVHQGRPDLRHALSLKDDQHQRRQGTVHDQHHAEARQALEGSVVHMHLLKGGAKLTPLNPPS